MNYSMISYIVGWILNFEGLFMLLPCLTAVIYGEKAGFAFVVTMALCFVIGVPLTIRKPKNMVFYTKEGFISVSLSWIVMSVMGSLPFLFSGATSNPVDALFETVSGFTTTGASISAMWRACPTAFCSGEALLTGSAEWAFSSLS